MVRFKMFIRFKRNSLVLLPVIITSLYSNIFLFYWKLYPPRLLMKRVTRMWKIAFWAEMNERRWGKKPLMWTKQTCVPIGTIHIRRFHHDRYCAQATKTKQIHFFPIENYLLLCLSTGNLFFVCFMKENIEVSVWCGFVLFAFASLHLILVFFFFCLINHILHIWFCTHTIHDIHSNV